MPKYTALIELDEDELKELVADLIGVTADKVVFRVNVGRDADTKFRCLVTKEMEFPEVGKKPGGISLREIESPVIEPLRPDPYVTWAEGTCGLGTDGVLENIMRACEQNGEQREYSKSKI